MTHHKPTQSGFALLMALIVVSVVVSIGLTVLDLTLKQVRLSTNSKDSETAFHAANAGMECARYYRLIESDDLEDGDLPSIAPPSCFGVVGIPYTMTSPALNSYFYEGELSWGGATAPRCSAISMLVISSDITATTSVSGMETMFPGFPYGDTKDCEPGGRCTVIAVRGYSNTCANTTLEGTVQREVLLEL